MLLQDIQKIWKKFLYNNNQKLQRPKRKMRNQKVLTPFDYSYKSICFYKNKINGLKKIILYILVEKNR
jgi:ABC-type thiamine transport system substrate-binding protein